MTLTLGTEEIRIVSPCLISPFDEGAPKLGGRCASGEAAPCWPVLLAGGDIGSCLDDEDGPDAIVLVPNSIRDFFGGGGSGRRTRSSKAGASTVPWRGWCLSRGDCTRFG